MSVPDDNANRVVSFDDESLILVDSNNTVLGHKPKVDCHRGNGMLHRAFSIFLFNSAGDLMLQQRSRQQLLQSSTPRRNRRPGRRTAPVRGAGGCCTAGLSVSLRVSRTLSRHRLGARTVHGLCSAFGCAHSRQCQRSGRLALHCSRGAGSRAAAQPAELHTLAAAGMAAHPGITLAPGHCRMTAAAGSDDRSRVESALEQRLATNGSVPPALYDAMRYAVLGNGKRIRPQLLYATGRTLGIPLERLDAPACAVELIHAYSLVHDDLPAMDNDDLRRGRPTLHIAFDEATAILAGDALQALAFHVLAVDPAIGADAAIRARLMALLTRACGAQGMVGGQALDITSNSRTADL